MTTKRPDGELDIGQTGRGFAYGKFKDRYGVECSLQKSSLATEDCIWLGVHENRMHLTQEMVAMLLPALTAFAETGDLIRTPTNESPAPQAEGRLPERETFWLIERAGHGQWIRDHGYGPNFDLTNDVWHAHRYGTERDAHDRWRYLTAEDRRQYKLTEHIFIHGTAPQPPVEGLRDADVMLAMFAFWDAWPGFRDWWGSLDDGYGHNFTFDHLPPEPFEQAIAAALASPSLTAGPKPFPPPLELGLALIDACCLALDNSEQATRDGEEVQILFEPWASELCAALDRLDELPDDQPGYVMSSNMKLRWALRTIGVTSSDPNPPAPATLIEQSGQKETSS